jgi:hypothetical protein
MYLTRTKKVATNEKSEEVGYWRKANQIHSWFVHNCQGGVDECQMTLVTKEKLEELLVICLDISKNKDNVSLAKKELPTQLGFFFGGTEYDEYYYHEINETIDILKKVLAETDFEKQTITYQSSW